MSLRVVCIVFAACQLCSSEMSIPRYDLCTIGEALTSPKGRLLYATTDSTYGHGCSRIILAPLGHRIEVNITIHNRIRRQVYVYVYDGATRYDTDKVSFFRYGSKITVGTSNAVLVYIIKTTKDGYVFPAYVEITYKMFEQPKRCQKCWPVSYGITVCSFRSIISKYFYEEDTLYKHCTVFCDQNRYLMYGFSRRNDYQMKCWMVNREYDKYGKGNKWNRDLSISKAYLGPPLLKDQPLTCARMFPASRLKLGYTFSYSDISCADVNQTIFKEKIHEYISSIGAVASAGSCFKHPNTEENINCSVESVNITCMQNKRSSQVTLIVRDNIINSSNETLEYQRFFTLFSAFSRYVELGVKLKTGSLYDIEDFISENLTVKNKKAVDISGRVYSATLLEDCPNNAGYRREYSKLVYGCLKCPLHFYKQDMSLFTCQECKNGTRRNNNETNCVSGPRSYPKVKPYCKHTCRLGKFFNANSSLCEWCPYGSYQNSTTALDPMCTPCPDDLTTGFVGARNISECIHLCPAGFYLQYTKCVKCGVGYYMPIAGNRLEKCYKCPSGFTTLGVATTDGCVKSWCSLGEYLNMTTRNCTPCPKNTYQDNVYRINTSCKRCPRNSITATTGTQWNYDCLRPCKSGEFFIISSRRCSSCPRNTYQDEVQHVNLLCKSCGLYEMTKSIASTSASDCIPVICGKGKFVNRTSKSCEKCADVSQGEIGCPTPKTVPLPTQPPLTTTEPIVASTAAVSRDDDDGDDTGLIVGVVFGLLVFCIIVSVVVLWWMKQKKASRTFGPSGAFPLKETY